MNTNNIFIHSPYNASTVMSIADAYSSTIKDVVNETAAENDTTTANVHYTSDFFFESSVETVGDYDDASWPAYLTWIQKVFATLSIICSYAICREILADLRQQKESNSASGRRRNRRNGSKNFLQSSIARVLLNLSVSDILFSIAVFLGEWMAPKDTPYIHHAMGNQHTCTFQGWLRALGYLASPMFSVALNGLFLLLVKYRWDNQALQRLEKRATIGIWSYALILSVIPIPLEAYNSDWDVCWIAPAPLDCLEGECERGMIAVELEIYYSFVHIWFCMVFSTMMMASLYWTVRNLEDSSAIVESSIIARTKMSASGTSTGRAVIPPPAPSPSNSPPRNSKKGSSSFRRVDPSGTIQSIRGNTKIGSTRSMNDIYDIKIETDCEQGQGRRNDLLVSSNSTKSLMDETKTKTNAQTKPKREKKKSTVSLSDHIGKSHALTKNGSKGGSLSGSRGGGSRGGGSRSGGSRSGGSRSANDGEPSCNYELPSNHTRSSCAATGENYTDEPPSNHTRSTFGSHPQYPCHYDVEQPRLPCNPAIDHRAAMLGAVSHSSRSLAQSIASEAENSITIPSHKGYLTLTPPFAVTKYIADLSRIGRSFAEERAEVLTSRAYRKSRAVAIQGIFYTLAFLSTHLLDAVASVLWKINKTWMLPLDIAAYVILQPALGVLNFLVFVRNRQEMSTPEGRFLRACLFCFGVLKRPCCGSCRRDEEEKDGNNNNNNNNDDERATTTAPQSSSTSSVPASPPSKPRANLALCRTDGTGPIGCLGGVDTHAAQPFQDILQPLPLVEPQGRSDGSTSDEQAQPPHSVHTLNWRYEDGLLRAVDSHGYATNKCLGPFGDAVSLKGYSVRGKSCTPYELVLRDCPAIDQTETFDYNASNERPTSAAVVESEETAASTSSFRSVGESARVSGTTTATTRSSTIEREPEAAPAASSTRKEREPPSNAGADSRHMRFLLTEDGRVQSLAPVIDLANGNKDISTSKPFCLTVMKWREDTHTKAYLTPCHEDNVFNVVDKESGHLADHTRGQQQQFDIADGSSFDPFLVAWQSEASNESDGAIHLAYQTGREASAAQQATNNNNNNYYGYFDTLMVRVMGDGYCSSLECSFMFDIELGKKGSKSDGSTGSSTSGIISLSREEFKAGGNTKAYLMGTTEDGSEVSNFASTSFVVSKQQEALSRSGSITENSGNVGDYQGWFLGLFVFLGIMFLYMLCVVTKKAVCGATERRGSRPSLDSNGCAKADATRACNSLSVGDGSTCGEYDGSPVSDYTNNNTHYRSNDDLPLEASSSSSFSRHTTRRSSMPRTRNPVCFYSEYYPDTTKTTSNTAAIEDEEKTISAEISSEFFNNK